MSKPLKTREDLINCAKGHIMAVVITTAGLMGNREKGLSESDRVNEITAIAESVNFIAGRVAKDLTDCFEEYFNRPVTASESGLAAMAGFAVPPTSGAVLQEVIDKRLLEAGNRIHEIVSKELIDAGHAVKRAALAKILS